MKTERIPTEDIVVRDRRYMAEALAMACGVPVRTWPNPPVGALVVQGESVVGRGGHQGAGCAHAEAEALAEAGEAARGATLYVTLEPCNHQGRTPPCAPAVVEAGIRRVVIGVRDPNPAVKGGGTRYLRERGLEVVIGVRGDEVLEAIWPFVVTDGFQRPYVELKTAVSLDGRFAPLPQDRSGNGAVYLTRPPARHDVHRRRRRVDLVLVGSNTARDDNPRLDGLLARSDGDVPAEEPQAGYVDTGLSWSGGLARERYLVFTGESARDLPQGKVITSTGGELVFCGERDGRVDPVALLEHAAEREIHTIMLEGGPRLAASFLAAGLVDRWLQYQAPIVLGSGKTWPDDFRGGILPHRDFSLTRVTRIGEDLLTVHDRLPFAATLARVTI